MVSTERGPANHPHARARTHTARRRPNGPMSAPPRHGGAQAPARPRLRRGAPPLICCTCTRGCLWPAACSGLQQQPVLTGQLRLCRFGFPAAPPAHTARGRGHSERRRAPCAPAERHARGGLDPGRAPAFFFLCGAVTPPFDDEYQSGPNLCNRPSDFEEALSPCKPGHACAAGAGGAGSAGAGRISVCWCHLEVCSGDLQHGSPNKRQSQAVQLRG